MTHRSTIKRAKIRRSRRLAGMRRIEALLDRAFVPVGDALVGAFTGRHNKEG